VVSNAVRSTPDASVRLLTQNDPSTGVFNRIDEITAALPKEPENRPLVLVDGVSSVGAMPCFPEEWSVDGLAAASQKGLLTPPGLGLVWLSARGWAAVSKRKCPSYYFDLVRQKRDLDKEAPENPYTPPVSLYYALDAALCTVLADDWFSLRARAARALATGIEALGFTLLVSDEKYRSPGVTAFYDPSGATRRVAENLQAMGIEPAGGQGKFKGRLIRMSHYHDVRWPEISLALGGLYAALEEGRGSAGDFMRRAFEVWEAE
jgi:aspartate aminotransferase-like enzyme